MTERRNPPLSDPTPPPAASGLVSGVEASLPRRFRVEETHGGLRIGWRWFTPSALLGIPAVALFSFPSLAWLHQVYPSPEHSAGAKWIMAITALPFTIFAAALAYHVAGALVNRSELSIREGHLRLRHGPLWFERALDVPAAEVESVEGTAHDRLDFRLSGGRRQHTIIGMDRDLVAAGLLARRVEQHLRSPPPP